MGKRLGITHASALDMLRKKGGALTESGVYRIETLVNRYSLRSSHRGYDRLFNDTAETFKRMDPKVRCARKRVRSAEKKLRGHKLAEEAFLAEVAPVGMAISLHDRLKQIFAAVTTAPYKSYLIFVNIAVGVLSRRLDDALMRKGRYQTDTPDILSARVEHRLSAAFSLYNDVTTALAGVPEKLRIALPIPPKEKV